MDKKTAVEVATKKLSTIIAAQPNLFQYEKAYQGQGNQLANFCIEFIETYATWLEEKSKQGGN